MIFHLFAACFLRRMCILCNMFLASENSWWFFSFVISVLQDRHRYHYSSFPTLSGWVTWIPTPNAIWPSYGCCVQLWVSEFITRNVEFFYGWLSHAHQPSFSRTCEIVGLGVHRIIFATDGWKWRDDSFSAWLRRGKESAETCRSKSTCVPTQPEPCQAPNAQCPLCPE